MTWRIKFYNEKVEAETLALPAGILANFLRIAELIQEFGLDLGHPHTAPLGKGLSGVRAKGREDISQSVFCTVRNKEIVILLTVIKKDNKIPKYYMETVQK
ncbi:type II toxin-antitoxin system RelE/ParE family toxin [Nitrosomonas sp. JL21]|uniref:type II toxin-antitoxin system RelE/ParE family toxin n=1 Tax=Nitrosomonas sp. JL21 TaxID=153949 RepID=UPI001368C556|nr:type II toxin-antitoxin system RelE/ParE family toxin [Nitrosomonas sp. JL21]MXS77065.1 type II toxin-antitoxin system RelE/ParE family toxin [Nitrosomonas sp. JL21]